MKLKCEEDYNSIVVAYLKYINGGIEKMGIALLILGLLILIIAVVSPLNIIIGGCIGAILIIFGIVLMVKKNKK